MISDYNVKLALIHFTKMKLIHSDYMVNFCQDIKRKLNLKWFETTKNKNLKRVKTTSNSYFSQSIDSTERANCFICVKYWNSIP